ncbi:MAG TPA: peptidase, partial [Alteromonas sp.]|nr:peptidase [Alteromonas sp.]
MNKIFSLLIYICFFNVSAQGFDNAKLDQYLKSLDVNERAMLSVAIVQNGQPIYQNSIGFVDVLTKQRANENTQYQIGSITKVFTSTMIFQLIDEGKLSLNTKLAKFYPKIKNSEEITISMLLSHRSGIHNFTDSPDFNRFKVRSKTKDEMISLIESLGSDFRPDSRANYSNSGYVLLG